jgi:cytochrome P450
MNDLIDSTLTFYFAGKETTAIYLEMLIFYFAKYPDYYEKIVMEV